MCSNPSAYPSINSSSSPFTARPSSRGKVVILLKDRLSCRSDGQVTAGSKVSIGPTQLRETFSMFSESRDSSSTGSDWSWLPWRSSRVRLFKFCQIENKQQLQHRVLLVIFYLGDSAHIRGTTWQRAEGNSSRQLWLRSRRRRCPSCCWTKTSSIRQDREFNSLPDRSSRRILSFSLGRAAEFSPDPNTEEETDH